MVPAIGETIRHAVPDDLAILREWMSLLAWPYWSQRVGRGAPTSRRLCSASCRTLFKRMRSRSLTHSDECAYDEIDSPAEARAPVGALLTTRWGQLRRHRVPRPRPSRILTNAPTGEPTGARKTALGRLLPRAATESRGTGPVPFHGYCLALSKAASKAMLLDGKSTLRTKEEASAAPCTRSMRMSSHSTDSGPR